MVYICAPCVRVFFFFSLTHMENAFDNSDSREAFVFMCQRKNTIYVSMCAPHRDAHVTHQSTRDVIIYRDGCVCMSMRHAWRMIQSQRERKSRSEHGEPLYTHISHTYHQKIHHHKDRALTTELIARVIRHQVMDGRKCAMWDFRHRHEKLNCLFCSHSSTRGAKE